MSDMWTYYRLDLIIDRLVGGIPKHPDIVRRWQEARWPASPEKKLLPGDPKTPEEAAAQTVADLGNQAMSIEEATAGIWTGFPEKDGTLVLEARLIKAMLKESANIVRNYPETYKNGKATYLRAQVAERVFVAPKFISLGVTEALSLERPIHVMTPQGPRTALKKTDYLDDVKVSCDLKVLNDGLITKKILDIILEHASENGLGTDRSQGNGTFVWVLDERPTTVHTPDGHVGLRIPASKSRRK
jgi:hypothetical protein